MIEYIDFNCGSHFGASSTIEIKFENDSAEYEYFNHGKNMANYTSHSGTLNQIEAFIKSVEGLNLYGCKDEYDYEDYFVLDGWSFSLSYKEIGKEEKYINGQDCPDFIKQLIKIIKKQIPNTVFPTE